VNVIAECRTLPHRQVARSVRWTLARATIVGTLALALVLTFAVRSARADTIFSDGFESGDFSAWSQVQLGGNGTAVVQSAIVSTGTLAAQLSESSTAGSRADVRKTFSAEQLDLTATGDFQVLQQGASGGNVPLFRFLDASSNRIVSLYRQNGTSGSIGVGYAGGHFTTSGKLALHTWATIGLHVIINGTTSTIEVSLNGQLIYQATNASLGTAGVSTVQIGNDTAAQPFTIVVDTINVQNGASTAPSPPVNMAPPAASGVPQDGQTLTASTGSWTGTQPIRYSYQWMRCDATGANCGPITGAISASYAVTSADVGSTLRVVVTATNSVGAATSTSAATTVVQAPSSPPVNTGAPTISGTPQDGQMLNADPGSWSGTQPISYSYQWMRCDPSGANCGPIAGATGASYVVTGADVGDTLQVVVTAGNTVASSTATSNVTAIVQPSSTGPTVVALWHMDETSGSTMYDSIAGHNGALFHVKLGQPGFLNLAYGFNGSSSYVSVPSADSLNPGAATVTITIHLQTTGTPPAPPADWDVFRKGLYTTAGGEFKMEFQQSGQASCGFEGSGGYSELIAGPKINDGQWHTVQCVKTASKIELIVDGLAYSQAANLGAIANTAPVVIGARPGSDWYLGALDEASIQVG
jgi:hypothetical protein